MDSQLTRSEQVVEAFKRHKLTISALKRIREMIQGFERGGQLDSYIARIGLVLILIAIAGFSFYYFGKTEIVIP